MNTIVQFFIYHGIHLNKSLLSQSHNRVTFSVNHLFTKYVCSGISMA